MVEAAGVEPFRGIENKQVVDSTRRQNRQNSHNRSTEVHGGYTALFSAFILAPKVLPVFPFTETFRTYEDFLAVGVMLCLAVVPVILIGYEHWKERAR
jgi:hypothetical protein